jgi:hypothetical protein
MVLRQYNRYLPGLNRDILPEMGRPRNQHPKKTVELQASPKLLAYLNELLRMEGFGDTRPEIVKRLVWDGINKLLAEKRLKQR